MASLTARDLRDYRIRSEVTLREVAKYCNVSYQLIEKIENGQRSLTDNNLVEIAKGINIAKRIKAKETRATKNIEESTVPALDETNKSDGETKPKPKPKTKKPRKKKEEAQA